MYLHFQINIIIAIGRLYGFCIWCWLMHLVLVQFGFSYSKEDIDKLEKTQRKIETYLTDAQQLNLLPKGCVYMCY